MFVGLVLFPVALAAYYGFFRWQGYGEPTDWSPPQLQGHPHRPLVPRVLAHNRLIVVLSLAVQGPTAIGLALLLNRKMRGRALIRVLIFVPYVISEVIVGTGFSLMLQTSARPTRAAQHRPRHARHDWLADPSSRSGR